MSERTGIVDDEGRFLYWEPSRARVHTERLIHRTVNVFVFDGQGRVLVQLRSPSKHYYPSTWDVSCAGHVEEADYPAGPDEALDAVYLAAARRELGEELGIVPKRLVEVGRFGPSEVLYEQARLYLTAAEGPYRLQEEEVSEVRLLDEAELDALLEDPARQVAPTLRFFRAALRERGIWGCEGGEV